jgi:DNA polymerase-3 subunit chi
MTRIEFHYNTAERLLYTCRLLRKVRRRDLTLGVLGAEATLQLLDAKIWAFSEIDFLPHSSAADPPQIQVASPIRLHTDPSALCGMDVLVNLGDDVPVGFESFARLIEIVANDDHGRISARQRWRHYKAAGYVVDRHDLTLTPVS